jgi:hypothetical protein
MSKWLLQERPKEGEWEVVAEKATGDRCKTIARSRPQSSSAQWRILSPARSVWVVGCAGPSGRLIWRWAGSLTPAEKRAYE